VITYTTGKAEVKCPVCGKQGVKAFVKPSYLVANIGRISGKTSTKYYRIPESCDYQGKCPHCGASQKEMQKALETGISKRMSHEERLKKIKEAGLPTVIEG